MNLFSKEYSISETWHEPFKYTEFISVNRLYVQSVTD